MDVRVHPHLTPALMAGAALLAAPAGAGAHSLVRPAGGTLAYLSADATSLNAVTVRERSGELVIRDTEVDGGMDPGRCDPGDVTRDRYAFIIEALCPKRGTTRLRLDLGEREDRAVVHVALPASVDGGPGRDDLTGGAGADELDGGQGPDRVVGGAGDDVVTGGDGPDRLDGGTGDDLVRAADGVADVVTCGAGTDRVDADERDQVGADCEQVTRTAVPPPPFGADGSDRTAPSLRVVASPVQRVGRSRTVRFRVTSTERGTVAGSGGLFLGDLALPVETARQSIDAPGGGAELVVRLRGRAWTEASRALRRGRRAVVRVGVVATDLAGNSREVRPRGVRLRR